MAVFEYDAHLALLTDLLSPGELPPGLLSSLAYHLTILDTPNLAHLAKVVLKSEALWMSSPPAHDLDVASTAPTLQAPPQLDFRKCQEAYAALQFGFTERARRAAEAYGKGWRARHSFKKSINALWESIRSTYTVSSPDYFANPLTGIIVASAVTRTLQGLYDDKEPPFPAVQALLRSSYAQLTDIWNMGIPSLSVSDHIGATVHSESVVAAWVLQDTLVDVTSEQLAPLVQEPFLDFAFAYIKQCFQDGYLLNSLHGDLQQTEEGLQWRSPSESLTSLSALKDSLAHQQLGRFSRVLGKVIESVSNDTAFQMLLPRLARLEDLAANLNTGWASCRWSEVQDDNDLHPDTRQRNEPWTILKTALFTLTMVYSSLIALLNSIPLSSDQPPSDTVLDLVACSLRTFSHLYFVTSKFGTDGFGAYRSVWYGALDLAARGRPAKVQQIVSTFEPYLGSSTTEAPQEEGVVSRSTTTYYLNAVEQLIAVLPDAYLEERVLPLARPYLNDATHRDAFESAHSVVLAIFARRKAVASKLVPWYSKLLLESYPERMSIAQLRLAYTTMVGCVAESDPVLTWYCLNQVFEATASASPIHHAGTLGEPGTSKKQNENTLAHISQTSKDRKLAEAQQQEKQPGRTVDELVERPPTRLDEAEALDPLTKEALKSPRGYLLVTVIDQATAVDASLLVPLLDRIAWFLGEEAVEAEVAGSSQIGSRRALAQMLYRTLASGMDMTKRELAAKWWLERRQDLEWAEEDDNDDGRSGAAKAKARL